MEHNRQDMITLFKDLDTDGDGISIQELRDGIKNVFCQDLSNEALVNMMIGFDQDGDKKISEAEFLDQMCDKLNRKVTFTQRFKDCDADGNGKLSVDELRQLLDGLVPEENVDDMMSSCDSDSDGKISLEEFLRAMK